MSDAEAIASRLTPAQKRALLRMPPDLSWTTLDPPSKRVLSKMHYMVLRDRGGGRCVRCYRLTPLGLAVRAALLAEAARHE